jgi:hypothetical protein
MDIAFGTVSIAPHPVSVFGHFRLATTIFSIANQSVKARVFATTSGATWQRYQNLAARSLIGCPGAKPLERRDRNDYVRR